MTRLAPGLLVAALAILFAAMSLAQQGWNPRSFALIGTRFELREPGGTKGYDGQFAYYIATDPLGAADNMDAAAYRYLRVIYPGLAWALSLGGQVPLAGWVLIGINVIALAAIAVVIGDLVSRHGASRWYGIVVPLTAGMLFALRADLNEPLALALALGAVWVMVSTSRLLWAVVLLALSALSKETGYVYAAGFVAWLLVNRRWRESIGVGVGALAPVVLWGLLVGAWLGDSPFATERTRFEPIPFGGLPSLEPAQAQLILAIWIVAPCLALGLGVIRDLQRGSRDLYLFLLAANILFVMFLPRASYIDAFAVMRLSAGMMAAAYLWAAASRRRRWLWILTALWLPSALLLLILPGVLAG